MSQLCECDQYPYRSKNLLRFNMHRQRSISKEDAEKKPLRFAFSKIHRTISRYCFAGDGKEMYQDSTRTCTAIVLLIKPFVWCRSRRRRGRGLLKLSFVTIGLGDWGYITDQYDALFCQQVSYEMCFTSSAGQHTSFVTFILVTQTRTVSSNKRWGILGSSSAKENLPG